MGRLVSRFLRDESGATAIEYCLIASGIAFAIIGTVQAIGPGGRDEQGKRIPLDVNTGDTVLFAKYAGTEFKIDGKKLLILKENDLLAIVQTSKETKRKM